MLKIFLIRHGQTGFDRTYKGHLDVPITEEGRRRMRASARLLKKLLRGQPLNAVYCSDLKRTVQSAGIIIKPFHLKEAIAVSGLRERYFGLWEGLKYDEIEKRFPKEFADWVKDPFKNSPVEGESTGSMKRRLVKAANEITSAHKNGENIAIVTHSGPLRVLLCYYLGAPMTRIFRVSQDYGCINRIDLFGTTPIVKFTNWRPLSE